MLPAGPADLADCAREPIHIPGAIQPHGILLSLREHDLTVLQVSGNLEAALGVTPDGVLGKELGALMPESEVDQLRQHLDQENLAAINPLFLRTNDGTGWDGIVHRSGGLLLLELEPAPHGPMAFPGFYHLVRGAVGRLRAAADLQSLYETGAGDPGAHRLRPRHGLPLRRRMER